MGFNIQRFTAKSSVLSLLILQAAQQANGHYGFPIFILNGVASEWWEYIRPVGLDANGGMFYPIMDWTGEVQVCGHNGTNTGHLTNTAKVEAGSTIGFRSIAASYSSGIIPPHPWDAQADHINHDGPGQLYMSKAPGALEDYKGDGEWFKVGLSGSTDGLNWDSRQATEMNFTIPKTTPPGKYLVRVEHFNISPDYNMTQQFINCAHVEVVGPGGGTPGPMIKFPGAYDITDNAIWLPRALWYPHKPSPLLKAYKGPGPAIWTG